jgi:hypothetical protein
MDNFDPGHDYDENEPKCAGFTSAENLRNKALFLFGRILEKISKREVSTEITPAIQKYLPVEEVELILKDHAEIVPDGFIVGAETREDMEIALRELMASLINRIMSNVLARGVSDGFLECIFDGDVNDFQFLLTEKGMQLSDEYERTNSPIED